MKKQVDALEKLAKKQGRFTSWDILHLGIPQYNARVFDLRERFGCTCADRDGLGPNFCKAKEHIRCESKNHYVYINDKTTKKVEKTQESIKWSTKVYFSGEDLKLRIAKVNHQLDTESDPVMRRILEFRKSQYEQALPNQLQITAEEALL